VVSFFGPGVESSCLVPSRDIGLV